MRIQSERRRRMKGEAEDEELGRGRAWQTVVQDEVKAKEAGMK